MLENVKNLEPGGGILENVRIRTWWWNVRKYYN